MCQAVRAGCSASAPSNHPMHIAGSICCRTDNEEGKSWALNAFMFATHQLSACSVDVCYETCKHAYANNFCVWTIRIILSHRRIMSSTSCVWHALRASVSCAEMVVRWHVLQDNEEGQSACSASRSSCCSSEKVTWRRWHQRSGYVALGHKTDDGRRHRTSVVFSSVVDLTSTL